ncbi:MAG: hypothetical protein QHC90_01315 [Shinella sp.]|nr:hypothetical protein [Shinella sp.]
MNALLTFLLLLTVLWLLAQGLSGREKLFQFPFLTGVITFSFILPQVPALINDRFLPDGAFARTVAFTILCLVMCRLGWSSRARPLSFLSWNFDYKKLLIVSYILSIAGAYFYFKLSRLPGDLTIGVQISGMPVVYLFIARLMSYGLCIAILCLARRVTWPALLIIGFDLIFYLDRIVVTGKRAEAIELVGMFCLAFWFHRRWAPPRVLVLGGVLLGTLLMNSMGDYREITRENSRPVWQEIGEIDVEKNLRTVLEEGGFEFRNAIMRIHHTNSTMEFDYGKFHWNRLVFSFVPSQFLGTEFKESLMLAVPATARDYDPVTGTTETGMADAFQSFWYLGALKFLILAYLMCRLWASAERGEMAGQLVYILSIVPAMHAVSHQTDWVLTVWVHMLIFLVPSLAFAIVPGSLRPDWRAAQAASVMRSATDRKVSHEVPL